MGYIGGSTNYPLWYNINLPPYGNILASVYVFLTAYAIVRHRLMDIRIVVRQVTVYGVSLAVAVGFGILVMYLSVRYFPEFISPVVASLIVLILGIIIFQIVKERFGRFANRWLFYPLYSFEKTLEELSKKLSGFIDLARLTFLTTNTLKEVMKLDNIALILKKLEPPRDQLRFLGLDADQRGSERGLTRMGNTDKRGPDADKRGQDTFYLAKNIGFNEEEVSLLIKNKFLLHYLEKARTPLVSDELETLIEKVKDEHLKKKFSTIKKYMEKMAAALYLPLLIEDRLIGVFVLGKKVSGDAYSTQDLRLLETLSNQIAVAVNNAQLYEQMQVFNQILRARIIEATKELSSAYKELKRLDESKTEFLSLASHQLRTPLSVIKGYLSMVLEGDYGRLLPETEEAVKSVYESNERLIKLVDDLLNVTRIEAGRLEYNPVPSDLEKLIKEVMTELRLASEKKNLKLEYVTKKKLPEILIDPDRIRQVLTNLIDNAIKYIEKGSVIVEAIEKIKKL